MFKEGIDYDVLKSHSSELFLILKTCPGWRLNSLDEIKDFIRFDSIYLPIEVIYEDGYPRILFIDSTGDIFFSKYISHMKRDEINEFLSDLGYRRFN